MHKHRADTKDAPKAPFARPTTTGLLQASTGAWERRLASVGLALWLYRANVKDSPFYCGVGNTDHFLVLFCFVFQAFSTGRTRSLQIYTTKRRLKKKRSLGPLPSPLPTQRMHPLTHRPHIHRMTAGEKIIPVVSLAFFKRCQSTPATITGQHLPPQRQTRLWINEKGGALVAAWKGNSAGSTAPSQRKPQEGHSYKACHEHIMPEPNWNLRLKQYFVVFGEKRWVQARRKNKSCMQKRREKQPASWPWDNLDGGHWVKEV